jgi:hypothetical protein
LGFLGFPVTQEVMPREMYKKILACLHPDSRNSVSIERLVECFDYLKKKDPIWFSEKEAPTKSAPLPRTYAEMMAMNKRQSTNGKGV